jgi:hypothetical protein
MLVLILILLLLFGVPAFGWRQGGPVWGGGGLGLVLIIILIVYLLGGLPLHR